MKVLGSIACAFALLVETQLAFADPPIQRPVDPAALQHLDKATKLYDVRSFEQAIEEYKAGALVEAAPVFDYDLGQCYRQLHRYKDAIWHYQRFLRESPQTPEHDEAVKKFIEQMQAELDQKAMSAPPTDDANGVVPGAKQPPPVAPPVQPPVPTPAPAPAPWYDDPLGWSVTGGGVVALGVSGWLFLDARSLDQDSNREPGQTEQQSLRDRAHDRRVVGAVVGGVGLAAVAVGVIRLVVTPTSAEQPQSARLDVRVTSNGFVVAGRF